MTSKSNYNLILWHLAEYFFFPFWAKKRVSLCNCFDFNSFCCLLLLSLALAARRRFFTHLFGSIFIAFTHIAICVRALLLLDYTLTYTFYLWYDRKERNATNPISSNCKIWYKRFVKWILIESDVVGHEK